MQLSKVAVAGLILIVLVSIGTAVYTLVPKADTSFLKMRVDARVLEEFNGDFVSLTLKSRIEGDIFLFPEIRSISGNDSRYMTVISRTSDRNRIGGSLDLTRPYIISKRQVQALLTIVPKPTYYILTAKLYRIDLPYISYQVKPFTSAGAIPIDAALPYLTINPCPPADPY